MTESPPLITDADLTAHLGDLVGPALRRQTWLFPLDDEQRPLPVAIPIDGMPLFPDRDDVETFAERLRDLVQQIGASSVVLVWERPGGDALHPRDRPWVAGLRRPPVRAQLLSSDAGVRVLDAEEALAA